MGISSGTDQFVPSSASFQRLTLNCEAAQTAALTHGAALTQNSSLLTVIETPTFTRLWPDYWNEDERGEFVAWLVTTIDSRTG